jgi:hypothetical protein
MAWKPRGSLAIVSQTRPNHAMTNYAVTITRSIGLMALLASTAVPASGQERYVGASVDKAGALRIVTTTGQVIVPEPEAEREFIGKQVGYEHIQISTDRQAVGWVALFPNCCTSYPIPLALVVYSDGMKRSYTGNDLPVWRWRFMAGGSQVAFRQEAVHGGLGVNYELRDVRTGDLVVQYSPAVGPDNQPLRTQQVPDWVVALDADR